MIVSYVMSEYFSLSSTSKATEAAVMDFAQDATSKRVSAVHGIGGSMDALPKPADDVWSFCTTAMDTPGTWC